MRTALFVHVLQINMISSLVSNVRPIPVCIPFVFASYEIIVTTNYAISLSVTLLIPVSALHLDDFLSAQILSPGALPNV